MKAKTILAVALLVAGFAAPAWADPSGTYTVEGSNPDGGADYKGTVTLTKTGDTFKVEWIIGDHAVTGTAVGNDDILSIGYSSGTQPGVGLYIKEDGKWKGVWSYLGQTSMGTEVWSQ